MLKNAAQVEPAEFGLPTDIEPMESRSADALPRDADKWQYEPKWDGFRALAFRAGDAVDLRGKSGKPLGRYFPEVLAMLKSAPFERFVLDGELVIEIDGRLSFGDLQMRLHPAESRIRKLAGETPARFILFDCLFSPNGAPLTERPLGSGAALWKPSTASSLELRGSPLLRAPMIPTRRKVGFPATPGPMASSPNAWIAPTRAANGP